MKQKYKKIGIPEFDEFLSADRFPGIRHFVIHILSMFSSTYTCEQLFSQMKMNKTAQRTILTEQHLTSILKITSSQKLIPNFDDLKNEKRCIKQKIIHIFINKYLSNKKIVFCFLYGKYIESTPELN